MSDSDLLHNHLNRRSVVVRKMSAEHTAQQLLDYARPTTINSTSTHDQFAPPSYPHTRQE